MAVFRRDLKNAVFSTGLATFQWESPDTAMPGIHIRNYPGVAPEIWLVMTPGSDDLLIFQHNGRNYQEVVPDEGP